MENYKIETIQKGQQITIKSVHYTICVVGAISLYLKRVTGNVIYATGYFTKDGKSYAKGLPIKEMSNTQETLKPT